MSEKNGLPCNPDVERYVLGAILLDYGAYAGNLAMLSMDDFAIEKHRRIFRSMLHLEAHGQAIDRVTVAEELNRRGELQQVGGVSYIVSLDDGLPHILNLDSYLRILHEQTARRRILNQAHHLINRIAIGDSSAEIIASTQEFLAGVMNSRGAGVYRTGELPPVSEYAGVEPEYIHRPVLPRGNLIVFTGAPEAGKSSLAFALARDARIRIGIPCLILDRDNPANVVRNREVRLHIEPSPQWQPYGQWLGCVPEPDSPIVLDWVKNCDPKPIIGVDCLGSFLQGGDENDAVTIRAFFDRCRRLTGFGATVIVIHHIGKDTEQFYRGSSALHDAIDVGYRVTNFSSSRRLEKLRLQPFKHRFGESQEVGYEY